MPLKTSRRGLLKAGLIGTAVLVTGGGIASLSGCSREPDSVQGLRFLRQQDVIFLTALAPVILQKNYPGSLGSKAEPQFLKALDTLMLTLSEYSQNQLRQLFDLMSLGPARVISGGPLVGWEEASPDDVEAFLLGWRDSLFSLKRMGYVSLSKLVTTSWYAMQENNSQSGYPGPPKKYPA